jgi:formamidopyrimidine-DNA glycosylase
MPELPDVVLYVDALKGHTLHRRLKRIVLRSPFVLRSVDPPLDRAAGSVVVDVTRIGKRIVMWLAPPDAPSASSGDVIFLVLHLMIAGRLRWREPDQKPGLGAKLLLALLEFEHGTILFTEAGSKKRASMTLVADRAALQAIDRGGIEPLDATLEEFRAALTRESHTVKRALTDPRLFSGIGNAYSDEILHAARLSPLKLTRSLTGDEIDRLRQATRSVLVDWTERLRVRAHGGFPEKVTAFHDDMAVHGRFNLPCPICGSPVQRIVYADNECNYCAVCQTGGRRLADRAMSRLLREDWPRQMDEL